MSYEEAAIGFYHQQQQRSPITLEEWSWEKKYRKPFYHRLRLEVPLGPIKREEHKQEIRETLNLLMTKGIGFKIPKSWKPLYRQWIAYFRNCLELYDIIAKDKVFDIPELFERCIREGNEFTKFIKNSRSESLQWKECIESMDYSEYVHEEYSGYDSILHERYLIYWDDSDEIEDWPYSLIEPDEGFDEPLYKEIVESFLRSIGQSDYDESDDINVIEPVANKMTNKVNDRGETCLLKNTWGADGTGPWYSTRKIVPTNPGSTRDTGVPDIETLNCLKVIHKHARILSESCKHSANCSLEKLQSRISRVKRARVFMHVDFKKFGLTVDRRVGNMILEAIGKEDFKIKNVHLQVGDEVYITKRGGGALGWCDPLFALGVIAILQYISKRYKINMDFIVFNDDVEIGFHEPGSYENLMIYKDIILTELVSFGFFISYRKVYLSRMFVFLEEYSYARKCNMEKSQLAVLPYAKSLSTKMHWKAKFCYSEGYQIVQSIDIKELCMNTFQGDHTNYDRPFETGGWTRRYDHMSGLNMALVDASWEEISFFLKMSRYKEPHLMPKWECISYTRMVKEKERLISDAIIVRPDPEKVKMEPSKILSEEELDAYLLSVTTDSAEYVEQIPVPRLPPRRPEFRDTG
jgi:hypothetical protein